MLEIGSNILLQNLFFKHGGFVKDICKAHFAKTGYTTTQISSQLKRSFQRLLEWQQHQALLSQLVYLGIYEMSWKCCCCHLKKQENLFYHLLLAGKACFPLLPVFQSTQLHAHPANVFFS